MLLYVNIAIVAFLSGYASGYMIKEYILARKPAGRIELTKDLKKAMFKPFTTSKKLKPKVNNDEKAWMIENGRAT